MSKICTTKDSVRQGIGLSLLLFIVLMNDIIKELKEKAKQFWIGYRNLERVVISISTFADDLVIIAKNKSVVKKSIFKKICLHGRKFYKSME